MPRGRPDAGPRRPPRVVAVGGWSRVGRTRRLARAAKATRATAAKARIRWAQGPTAAAIARSTKTARHESMAACRDPWMAGAAPRARAVSRGRWEVSCASDLIGSIGPARREPLQRAGPRLRRAGTQRKGDVRAAWYSRETWRSGPRGCRVPRSATFQGTPRRRLSHILPASPTFHCVTTLSQRMVPP